MDLGRFEKSPSDPLRGGGGPWPFCVVQPSLPAKKKKKILPAVTAWICCYLFVPSLAVGSTERVSAAESVWAVPGWARRAPSQLPLSLRAHQAAPRHQGCVNRQLSSPSSIPFTTAPPTAALLHSHPQRRARHDAPHRASRAKAKRFLRTRCRRSVRKRCKRSHL